MVDDNSAFFSGALGVGLSDFDSSTSKAKAKRCCLSTGFRGAWARGKSFAVLAYCFV